MGMQTQALEPADRAPEGYRIGEPGACRIERWRGYRSSMFYARVGGSLLESRSFRWSKADPPPDTAAARAAYDELVARLQAAGWEPVAGGGLWYETSFVRAVSEGGAVVGHVPVVQPDAPTAQRDVPLVKPDVPVMKPDVPTAQPDLPVVKPEMPVAQPDTPVVKPGVPVAQPDVPALQPESPVAPVRPAFRRFKPGKLAYVGAAACATVVLAIALGARGHIATRSSASPPAARAGGQARQVHKVSSTRRAATGEHALARSREALVDLRIEARGTGSWLELRRVSRTGPVLYAGTLLPGTALHFRAARIWANMGAAGNLVVTENARPIALQGTYNKLFLPPGR
jgi:hypothetical protein